MVHENSEKFPKCPVGPTSDLFWLELGQSLDVGSPLLVPKIEDVDKYDYYYRDHFFPFSKSRDVFVYFFLVSFVVSPDTSSSPQST